MSFVYSRPINSPLDTMAGGEASLPAIMGAAYDAMVFVDNTIASQAAREEAYDRRIATVKTETGRDLASPYRRDWPSAEELAAQRPGENLLDTRKRLFDEQLTALQTQYPGKAAALRADVSIDDDARALAREADERLGRFMDSRTGFGKWAASLAGGLGGALQDPVQLATLAAGAGPGAGRTVAARILSVATREAAINGAVEAAMQPAVQSWRAKIGIDAGLDEAIKNIAFAAGIGGAFGGALQGGAEVFGRLTGRSADAATDAIMRSPSVDPRLKAAIGGDIGAAAERLPQIRDALPAPARGALDEAETIGMIERLRPEGAAPEIHERAIAAAMRADTTQEALRFDVDPEQLARMADQVAARIDGEGPSRAETLTDFLIARGGIADFRGELNAIGADRVSRRFQGRLVSDKGMALDSAREAAAEAGFFDRLYGTAEVAVARSTIPDLLDLIDEDMRGGRVVRPGDEEAAIDTGRDQAEMMLAELLAFTGPGLKDEDAIATINRALADGVDVIEAWELSTFSANQVSGRPDAAAVLGDIPFFDDDRLSLPRAGGLDDPGRVELDELSIAEADLVQLETDFPGATIPFFDGEEPMSVTRLRDRLAQNDNLLSVVEACRL